MKDDFSYTAFAGNCHIISDCLETMLLHTKRRLNQGETEQILIFEDQTGIQVDFDFRGTPDEILARLVDHPFFAARQTERKPQTGPGRPRLGVVCREISLLPRHWEWLERQPTGISSSLRKLVEDAMKREPKKERTDKVREATGRFMSVMAGNLPGFEEALRALYKGDRDRLDNLITTWPTDIQSHIQRLLREESQ